MVALKSCLISSAAELDSRLNLEAIPARPEPTAILMCAPTHFQIIDCKNPFMQGQANLCDVELAKRQWQELKKTFEKLGRVVHELPAQAGLEDMVFSANQVLPGTTVDGTHFVVVSNMVHESRQREVPHYEQWFSRHGYRILRLSDRVRFEGQGDAIWHPSKQILWGGYGHRSQRAAYEEIALQLDVPVLLLELVNDKFYHLDTAFCAIDSQSVLIYPKAFSAQGLELIHRMFATVIEICDADADNFAGNALALGRNVVLQAGSAQTCRDLRASGFTPIEVDTSEFMKSGGSVFCLKMMVY